MRYLWYGISTLLVVVAAGIPVYLWTRGEAPVAAAAGEEPPRLEAERHYYVFLTVIEVAPEQPDGASWDTGSAPDLAYEIRWQGQRVFESSTKEDTLVAKWTNVSLEARDLFGGVSLDDSIKAARITAREGEPVEFVVVDKDSTSGDDPIGAWSVPISRLRLGDQTWERPAGAIRSVACRVLPLDGVEFETLTK